MADSNGVNGSNWQPGRWGSSWGREDDGEVFTDATWELQDSLLEAVKPAL